MSQVFQPVVSVTGRVFLSVIFVMSAIGNKIPHFNDVAQMMGNVGVPAPALMLAGAIAFLLVGGASVILGYKARFGASLLIVFLVLASYYFHGFWRLEGADAQAQTIQFMKNLSLIGAMLFIVANGSGAGSLDTWLARRGLGVQRVPVTSAVRA